MNTHVNIFASEWCDMVFEGKNHEYGAFVLRQMSAKRHIIAIILSVSLFLIAVSAPLLIKAFSPVTKDNHQDQTVFTAIDVKPQEEKQLELPQPVVRRTIQFTPYEVTNEQVEQEQPQVIDDLLNTNIAIAAVTHDGVDDPTVPVEEFRPVTDEEMAPVRFVEQKPEFPGGDAALLKFLHDHINYPAIAAEMGITGRVILQFVVNKNGLIDRIELVRGIGGGCNEEAIRVLKLMPAWQPGRQNGKPVPVYFTLPFVFALKDQ